MPKHIIRLIVLIVVVAGVALAARVFFVDDSYYRYGDYRGDSVAEIASDKPRYLGPEYCQPCHAERYAEWSGGVHHQADAGKTVKCETCHGAAGGRDAHGLFEHATTGVDHPASGKLPVPGDTVKLCTLCHEKTPGRPAEQRQIVVASHAGTQQCKTCHNPHSPKIVLTASPPKIVPAASQARKIVSAARQVEAQPANASPGNAKSASCAPCHGANGVSPNPAWPSLAGQSKESLVSALKAYKSGARSNAMMTGVARDLSDADIESLAAYYASASRK